MARLDEEVTGEERYHLIERFLPTGMAYCLNESKNIQGMYLPDLGNGFIAAESPEAGLELLKYRINDGKTTITIPSENVDFNCRRFYLEWFWVMKLIGHRFIYLIEEQAISVNI